MPFCSSWYSWRNREKVRRELAFSRNFARMRWVSLVLARKPGEFCHVFVLVGCALAGVGEAVVFVAAFLMLSADVETTCMAATRAA